MPKLSYSKHSLSLYIAEHTRIVPKIAKLPAANHNRARKTLKLRQPNIIEHGRTLRLRQPIKIESYVTRVGSQSESKIASPESSWLGWKTLLCSRIFSVRYSPSWKIGSSTPPSPQLTHILLWIEIFFQWKVFFQKNQRQWCSRTNSNRHESL